MLYTLQPVYINISCARPMFMHDSDASEQMAQWVRASVPGLCHSFQPLPTFWQQWMIYRKLNPLLSIPSQDEPNAICPTSLTVQNFDVFFVESSLIGINFRHEHCPSSQTAINLMFIKKRLCPSICPTSTLCPVISQSQQISQSPGEWMTLEALFVKVLYDHLTFPAFDQFVHFEH